MTTQLQHRGAPGTAIIRRESIDVPQSRSHARSLKRAISREIHGDARQKRKQVSADIRKLLTKRKRIKQAARQIVRDRHLDIDKAYRTGGHGWNWSSFRKSLQWKKGRGRPIGARTSRYPELPEPTEETSQYRVIEPREEPRGYLPLPQNDEPEGVDLPGSYGTYRALPPGRETRPERMLPVPSNNPNAGTSTVVSPPRYRALPPGRPTAPDVDNIKRVGPGAPMHPQVGPHARRLLPAAGQTTRLAKMKLLQKKLSKD